MNTVKITLIADTHRRENLAEIPKCDILILGGDYDVRYELDIEILDDWIKGQPAEKVICIAGNHDFAMQNIGKKKVQSLLKHAIYLEDESVEIEGIKFWGHPWTPIFFDWAFLLNDKEMEKKVDAIPDDVDVLISHGPPYGIVDQLRMANGSLGQSIGCVALRDTIKKRIKPAIVVCGHIHEAYGYYYDRQTHFFNASFMDELYSPVNKPIIIDIHKVKDKIIFGGIR